VSVINAPTDDKPFGRTYTVKYLGNVVEGRKVTYLNLPTEELERMARAQINDGEPVWFGSDVGKYSDREDGILDTGAFRLRKRARSEARYVQGRYARLRRKLPYPRDDARRMRRDKRQCGEMEGREQLGAGRRQKRLFHDERAWFGQYVCQVVVDKKYLTPEQLAALGMQPTELEPWDPIGSLAD
jgi:bleomycin hydrolase